MARRLRDRLLSGRNQLDKMLRRKADVLPDPRTAHPALLDSVLKPANRYVEEFRSLRNRQQVIRKPGRHRRTRHSRFLVPHATRSRSRYLTRSSLTCPEQPRPHEDILRPRYR